MASDAQIRDDVISELAWDPQVPDAEGIGVNVSDGAVTLAGRTPTSAAKLAAARAAERVYGVRAVADDLEVERMTRHVRGVTGISDLITVTPPVSAANIEDRIEEAFKRQAQVDARQVRQRYPTARSGCTGMSTR